MIILIRLLKILTLLEEIKSLRMIIQTMKNLLVPILHMTSVLLIIYYIFSLIGMLLFGGMIRKDGFGDYPFVEGPYTVPSVFHLDNFNDFISSMVTLFTLMVVNNWMIQVSQYTYVTSNPQILAQLNFEGYNKNAVRFYFIAFYYFSVIIGINLVVAYVLDMYASTERLDAERIKTLRLMEK